MEPILIVFACICLAAITVLCVVATRAIIDARKQIARVVTVTESASRDINEVRRQLDPLLKDVHLVIQQAGSTLEIAERELAKVGRGADTFAGIADDIRTLERNLVHRLEEPINDITGIISGVSKGVSTFVRKIVNR